MNFIATPHIGWLGKIVLLVLLTGICGIAFAAGFQRIEIPSAGDDPAIRAMVWSPCATASKSVQLGPYLIQDIENCEVSGELLPLIVVSHGQGGSSLGHHDTAEALADAGFVVVTFNQPGDAFDDDSMAQQLGIFESRPHDVSRVISFMLQDWPSRRHLDGESIGVFGFSRGGYTALALAGAVPSFSASAERLCGNWWSFTTALCRQIKRKGAHLAPQADPRIRAIVVADPLNLFDTAGLRQVRIPVQLWASEHGGEGVALAHVEAIRSALPQAPEYHVAKGAGHFVYLAPCPAALKASAPRICEDPQGVDRSAWHQTMDAAITRFFQKNLPSGVRP